MIQREAAVCVCAVRDRDERQGEEVKDEGGKLKEPFAVSLFNLTIASKLERTHAGKQKRLREV